MVAEAEAVPPARDAGDAAGPAAGAVHDPEAGPATAGQGLGPTPAPSPTPHRGRRPRTSLDPGPGPGPGQSLDPEATLLHPKEAPGRDLKASPSQWGKMEAIPLDASSTE